jgi:hypothetical protein
MMQPFGGPLPRCTAGRREGDAGAHSRLWQVGRSRAEKPPVWAREPVGFWIGLQFPSPAMTTGGDRWVTRKGGWYDCERMLHS